MLQHDLRHEHGIRVIDISPWQITIELGTFLGNETHKLFPLNRACRPIGRLSGARLQLVCRPTCQFLFVLIIEQLLKVIEAVHEIADDPVFKRVVLIRVQRLAGSNLVEDVLRGHRYEAALH